MLDIHGFDKFLAHGFGDILGNGFGCYLGIGKRVQYVIGEGLEFLFKFLLHVTLGNAKSIRKNVFGGYDVISQLFSFASQCITFSIGYIAVRHGFLNPFIKLFYLWLEGIGKHLLNHLLTDVLEDIVCYVFGGGFDGRHGRLDVINKRLQVFGVLQFVCEDAVHTLNTFHHLLNVSVNLRTELYHVTLGQSVFGKFFKSLVQLFHPALVFFLVQSLYHCLTEVIIDIVRNILGCHIKGSKRILHATDEVLIIIRATVAILFGPAENFRKLVTFGKCGTGDCIILLPKGLHLLLGNAFLVFIGPGKGIVPRLKVLGKFVAYHCGKHGTLHISAETVRKVFRGTVHIHESIYKTVEHTVKGCLGELLFYLVLNILNPFLSIYNAVQIFLHVTVHLRPEGRSFGFKFLQLLNSEVKQSGHSSGPDKLFGGID